MSVSANEPTDAEDAISAGDGREFWWSGSTSMFDPPMQGWLALAGVVSDRDPDLAGLMVIGAEIVRAALGEEISSTIRDLARDLGLSQSGHEQLRAAVRADDIAFTAGELALQMSDAYGDVAGEYNGGDSESSPQFIQKIVDSFANSPLIAARSGDHYQKMKDEVNHLRDDGAFPRWKAACSLELPKILGGRTPIYCARRGHRWMTGGTHLGALELSYSETTEPGFEGRVLKGGGQVGQAEGSEYRDSLNEVFPSPFYAVVGKDLMGADIGISGWAYGIHLVEGPRAQILTKLPGLLNRQREHIAVHVGDLVRRSEQRVHSVLEKARIPSNVANSLVGLLASAARAVVSFIVDLLVKAWSETNLSTWTIWHTALIGTDQVPISVFTLNGRDQGSPKLRRVVGSSDDGEPITDDEYDGDDRDPIQERQARFLIGASAPDEDLFGEKYFRAVAKFGRPLAWQEPLETKGGLRILVPHLDRSMDGIDRTARAIRAKRGDEGLAAKSKQMYVSAIRADVRLERAVFPNENPQAKRRPAGKTGTFGFQV